jgi:hypothetical protein
MFYRQPWESVQPEVDRQHAGDEAGLTCGPHRDLLSRVLGL